mgnify:FL=1
MLSKSYVQWALLFLLVIFISPNFSIAEEPKESRSLDSSKNLDPGQP